MKQRSTFGWLDLIRGILLLVFGIIALCSPSLALTGLVIALGIIAIVSGISDIVLYVRLKRRSGAALSFTLVTGIISTLAGILLLLNPIIGRWILNVVFPVWIIAHCISRIASYGFAKRAAGKTAAIVMLCLNILGLLFGIFMVFNQSLFTISLGVLVGFALVVTGAGSIVEAISDIGSTDET